MNVKYVAYVAVMFLIVCGGYFAYADVYHYSDRIEVDGEEVLVQGDTWTESQQAPGKSLNISDIYTNGTPTVNILYYGATRDDGTDDWLAIQTAINATYDMGGGTVFFPEGRYHISKTLDFWGGIMYLGSVQGYEDLGTEIYLRDNSDCTMIEVHPHPDGGNSYFPTIKHLTLQGRKSYQSGTSHGIHVYGSVYDMFIDNVLVFDTHDWGFKFDRGKLWISNIYAEYCNKGVSVGGTSSLRMSIDTIYCALNYEENFVTIGDLRTLIVTKGTIGETRGCNASIHLGHTSGDVIFSNLEISGAIEGTAIDTIVNISTSGTAFSRISDSFFRTSTNSPYGIWKGSSVSNSSYEISNINKVSGTSITTFDNGVQYTTKNAEGTQFKNQGISVDGEIVGLGHSLSPNSVGLLAYYPTDENTGSIAYDSVGDNDCTLEGDPTYVEGRLGYALNYDTVGDYLESNVNFIGANQSFTVQGWVHYSGGGDRSVFSEREGTGDWSVGINANTLDIRIYDAGGTLHQSINVLNHIPTEDWTHIIFSYDYEDGGKMYFAINGVKEDSGVSSSSLRDTGDTFRIGYSFSTGYLFNGSIDEVKLHNRSLTSKEMNTEYLLALASRTPNGHLLPKTGGTLTGNTDCDGCNITADNVFIPADIFLHTDSSKTVASAGDWYNITWTHSVGDPKQNIQHTYNDNTNDTITINDAGVYNIKYSGCFNDTAASPDAHIFMRIIKNGDEVLGSGFDKDTSKQNQHVTMGHWAHVTLAAGDEVKIQFTSTATTVSLETASALYLDHVDSATVSLERIR